MIERAEGTDLVDADGRRYIDGVSSLWCNVHGHRHPLIDEAVREQLDRVAHSTMLGLTHAGAAELAGRLVEIAPPGLERVFYSESGSTAVEIALKMAFQYWRQREGERCRRTSFVCLDERLPRRHARLRRGRRDRPLPRASTGRCCSRPTGSTRATSGGWSGCSTCTPARSPASSSSRWSRERPGSASQPPGFLRRVRELTAAARRAADRRRGRDRVRPHGDDVRLRAGAGGAGLPLPRQGPDRRLPAAGGDADDRAHLRGLPRRAPRSGRTFFHGHTFTGNPLGCAAGARQPRGVRARADAGAPAAEDPAARRAARRVGRMPEVAEVRGRGFMAGIDLGEHDPALRLGHRVTARGPRARRDRAPARRHGRADAAAGDLEGRPAAAGRDRRRLDRGGLRSAYGPPAGRARPGRAERSLAPLRVRRPRAANARRWRAREPESDAGRADRPRVDGLPLDRFTRRARRARRSNGAAAGDRGRRRRG